MRCARWCADLSEAQDEEGDGPRLGANGQRKRRHDEREEQQRQPDRFEQARGVRKHLVLADALLDARAPVAQQIGRRGLPIARHIEVLLADQRRCAVELHLKSRVHRTCLGRQGAITVRARIETNETAIQHSV